MTVPTRSSQARLPGPGTYKIDPGASTISLTTRHLFGLGRVRGTFDVSGGRIAVDERTGETGAEVDVTVDVTVDAGSVDTGNAGRDAAVRSPAFLDSEAYPKIAFRSTGVGREGESWIVRGEVTARGGAAPVDLRVVELRETAGGLYVRAAATVDRYSLGMTKFKGMAARRVRLEIAARADRAD